MSANGNWDSLSSAVHKAVKTLEKKENTRVEAFYTSSQATEVTIRNSEILTQNKRSDSGVGFRVAIAGNKVGFACTNTLSGKSILETGDRALSIARVSQEIPSFALPAVSRLPKVKGLFDSRVADVTVDEAIEISERAVDSAESVDKRVIAKDGRVLFMSSWRGVTNTLGVDFEERETAAIMYIGGAGKQNSEVTGSCYDFSFTRKAELNPEKVGENVGEMVVKMFKPQPLKGFQGTAIFGPEAVSYQLAQVLGDALKGETVMSGRSAWTRKLGQTVASEKLTITDSATLENGFSSRSFDDEGCASQTTTLVQKGELKSFLHNATSAKALDTENTGNASRSVGGFDMVRSIAGRGYRAKPEIYPSNLIVKPGNTEKEKLVSETEKGVLIESLAGFPQAGSGLISAQLSRAFYIQNGEVQYPIKGGMVSGVAFDWLKKVSGISKTCKRFQNAVVPSLRVEDVKVVGN